MNTSANPVPNQDVDNPGRNAFLAKCVSQASPGGNFEQYCNALPAVPAGKIFVIQTITGITSSTNLATSPVLFSVAVSTGGATWVWNGALTPIQPIGAVPSQAGSFPVSLYQDSESGGIYCTANSGLISTVTANSFFTCALSGYLISKVT